MRTGRKHVLNYLAHLLNEIASVKSRGMASDQVRIKVTFCGLIVSHRCGQCVGGGFVKENTGYHIHDGVQRSAAAIRDHWSAASHGLDRNNAEILFAREHKSATPGHIVA